jgi:glycerophosphoryl diester phosphodiesterase
LKVSETTADALRKLDVGSYKGKEFAGEIIPSLEAIIATIPPARELFVEIKCGKEILPFLQDVIRRSEKMSHIIVISFDLETLAAFKQLMPTVPAYWLRGTDQDEQTKTWLPHPTEWIQTATDQRLDGLDVEYHGVNKNFVDAVKASGLKLYVWTVNDLEEARQLKELGVDGITTDSPGRLVEHLKESKN